MAQNDLPGALKAIDALEKTQDDKRLARLLRGRVLLMRKDNEGSRGVGPQVGGNTLTPTANLSDSYYYFTYPMDANPGGSGTWTVSSVNSTAFGVEIVS